MTYEILLGLLTFFGLLSTTVIIPILKLNANIVRLTSSVDQLKDVLNELKKRVNVHGADIDKIKITLENHEIRIKTLEM